LAMGLNEFAGYVAVSLAALATGYLAAAHGLRPAPFYPGIAFALIGLGLSAFAVRDTAEFAQPEGRRAGGPAPARSFGQILLLTSWRDRTLFAASQAGLANNLNDGAMGGLLPILLAARGLPLDRIALVAAAYPAIWGATQLATGPLSDRRGPMWVTAGGVWVHAVARGGFAGGSGR